MQAFGHFFYSIHFYHSAQDQTVKNQKSSLQSFSWIHCAKIVIHAISQKTEYKILLKEIILALKIWCKGDLPHFCSIDLQNPSSCFICISGSIHTFFFNVKIARTMEYSRSYLCKNSPKRRFYRFQFDKARLKRIHTRHDKKLLWISSFYKLHH